MSQLPKEQRLDAARNHLAGIASSGADLNCMLLEASIVAGLKELPLEELRGIARGLHSEFAKKLNP